MSAPTATVSRWWLTVAGGPIRSRVLLLLACVMGLDTADLGTVGAIAGQLERAMSLSNTQIGLLAATPSICSALVTIPMGMLVDRANRSRLLWITMLLWGVAQIASGLTQSFETLLLTRVALGAATAVTLPAVASLVGDLFPAGERGRIWGLIISGELVGAAVGYLIAGEAAAFGPGSWRYSFFALAVPSVLGALAIRRWMHEPARGGRGSLEPGCREVPALEADEADDPLEAEAQAEPDDEFELSAAQEEVENQGVPPIAENVLRTSPAQMSLWQAVRYVFAVRTNVVLIAASALGYFYFTGVVTFGLVYFEGRYGVAHGVATLLLVLLALGGLVGVIGGGRLADRRLEQGNINSRINVGAWSFAITAVFFLPALLAPSIWLAMPLIALAAVGFGARNPPLDAARLDIMHHLLWGRAEAVRSLLRRTTTACAPIVFGLIADQFTSGPGGSPNGAHGFGANASAKGLQVAFLILISTLVLGGLLTFRATRTYPQDVATAKASEEATAAAAPAPAPARQAATSPRT